MKNTAFEFQFADGRCCMSFLNGANEARVLAEARRRLKFLAATGQAVPRVVNICTEFGQRLRSYSAITLLPRYLQRALAAK